MGWMEVSVHSLHNMLVVCKLWGLLEGGNLDLDIDGLDGGEIHTQYCLATHFIVGLVSANSLYGLCIQTRAARPSTAS